MPLPAVLLFCASLCIPTSPLPIADAVAAAPLPAANPADMPMPESVPSAAARSPPLAPEPMTSSPTPAIAPETPPQPATPPVPVPAQGAAIRARYGAPDFVRREMDTELWRYDSQRCSVFFFLHRDGAVLSLRYIDTLPHGMDMAADPACVTGLDQRMPAAPAPATVSPGATP